MAPPDPSTNRTAGLGRSFRGLSTEDAPAHEHEAIPWVVSAAALATVASRPWGAVVPARKNGCGRRNMSGCPKRAARARPSPH